MKIDLEKARYYRGLGDIVMLAWLAAGATDGPDPLVFHRTSHFDLLDLLGMAVDPEPGGVLLDEVYPRELNDCCNRPRLDYIREHLGVHSPVVRPPLNLLAEDEDWALQIAGTRSEPLLLLFPQSAWKPREWPANYWVDLAWKLKKSGIRVEVLLQANDPRFHNTPSYRWNTPLRRVAALMKRADLVVGNDSFPAHLAGTVGTPTLTLLGPTRPTVFLHIPEVDCLMSTLSECTGCHFRAPFRAACDQGCLSLYRLFPEVVLERVLEKLRLFCPDRGQTPGLRIPLAQEPPAKSFSPR